MEDSIIYCSRDEWVLAIEKFRPLLLNEQEGVINSLSENFGFEPLYILYQKKGKVVISFVALTKANKIYAPFHLFYSAFWVEPSLSQTKYATYLTDFMKVLQIRFSKISMKLPVDITDIRPFIWCDFSVDNMYTYLKTLDDFSYTDDVNKNIRDLEKLGYTCRKEDFNEQLLDLNLQIFTEFGMYRKSKIEQIRNLFKALDHNLIYYFSCYLNEKLITSHILLVDPENKIAYTAFISRVEKTEIGVAKSVHSLSYDKMFRQLKEDGYENVDLLGANIASISAFKSKFNGTLTPYFIVDYSRNKAFFNRKKQQAVRLVKRILTLIN